MTCNPCFFFFFKVNIGEESKRFLGVEFVTNLIRLDKPLETHHLIFKGVLVHEKVNFMSVFLESREHSSVE